MERKTRPIRLRFTFNQQSGATSRDKIKGFAAVLARDVAIKVAEEKWLDLRDRVSRQIAIDVRREISLMAQRFKIMTIGISGGRSGAIGTLTSASEPAAGFPNPTYRVSGPRWAPRRPDYLVRKRKDLGHDRWFDARGALGAQIGRAETWLQAFGPIIVQITRKHMSQTEAAGAGYGNQLGGVYNAPGQKVRVSIANIRVAAFENITPRMLPALISGDINDVAPDGRTTGLIGLFPSSIAFRLGGNERFVPYRHAVEPFLGFVLTRAIPNAVMRRLQEGIGSDIRATVA